MWTYYNDLGFSLYTALSVYHVVTTLDECMNSEIEVSADLVCCH